MQSVQNLKEDLNGMTETVKSKYSILWDKNKVKKTKWKLLPIDHSQDFNPFSQNNKNRKESFQSQ